jgi:transposase
VTAAYYPLFPNRSNSFVSQAGLYLYSFRTTQLLMTIPGGGRRTAEVVVTALDKPERFANARQVSAYAELVPDQRQSGKTNKLRAITRRGSRLLRGVLVEVAWMLLRFNPWAQLTYERICGG